ncbi:MAG: nucleotidyltransferase domain-containing protein [Nitrospirae bacterium]|nr:nucleotidyltransferase domain-containing protein [Nitrospirota bacterium]
MISPPESLHGRIERIVTTVVDRFDPDKIVLFGSHARGEAGPDSDVDLLVIMPVSTTRREAAVQIGAALTDIPVPKDLVVFTPEDVEEFGDKVGTILKPALEEGVVLYERRDRAA